MRRLIVFLSLSLAARAQGLAQLDQELRALAAKADRAIVPFRAALALKGRIRDERGPGYVVIADGSLLYAEPPVRFGLLVGSPPRLVVATGSSAPARTLEFAAGKATLLDVEEDLGLAFYSFEPAAEGAAPEGLRPAARLPERGGLCLHLSGPGAPPALALVDGVDPLTFAVGAGVHGGVLLGPGGELVALGSGPGDPTTYTTLVPTKPRPSSERSFDPARPAVSLLPVEPYPGVRVPAGTMVAGSVVGRLLAEIDRHGRIRRGYLGVVLGGGGESGVEVVSVLEKSPAAEAGLRRRDRILAVDGAACRDQAGLSRALAVRGAGAAVKLLLGDGRTVEVTLADREEGSEGLVTPESLGLECVTLTAELARYLSLGEGAKGVVVTSVLEGSVAAKAGLRRGDVVVDANGGVADLEELRAAVAAATRGVNVRVLREGVELALHLPARSRTGGKAR